MKHLLLSTLLCLALVGAAVVAADKVADKTKKETPATKPAKPINKFCAVERENPIDPTVKTVTYEGKVIGFCCDDCVPKFEKNPKAYMKDLK